MLTGSCFCGDIRFRLTPPTEFVSHCHCQSCRRSHGAPLVTWTAVPLERFELLSGQPRSYESSPGIAWEFCPRCGSSLFYRSAQSAGKIYAVVANLDDLDQQPDCHVSFEEAVPWLDVGDTLPKFFGKTDTQL